MPGGSFSFLTVFPAIALGKIEVSITESVSLMIAFFPSLLRMFGCLAVVLVFSINSVTGEDSQTETLREKLNLPAIEQGMKPSRLLEIIDLDWKLEIDAETDEEENRQMEAVLKHIIKAADFILSDSKAQEKTALKAVQHKMQALGILARRGDSDASVQALAMAKQLQQDKRPLLAREGKLITLSNQLREIPKMNRQQRESFIQELLDLFSNSPMTSREIQIAQVTAQIFQQAGKTDSAQALLNKTARILEQSSGEQWRQVANQFRGTARRYGLPGHPMKLLGKTLEGETIDLKNLKGKVVLVQFWASWCTYCLQEMPHLLKLYHLYHKDGFEIVGVNLDDSAERARKIIKEAQLPWPQIFSTEKDSTGMNNRNATYYGITRLPQCILIDRNGNVVSLQARGKILDQQLERLFIPLKQR